MKTGLKIQITLIVFVFSLLGATFTKIVDAVSPASYQKDTSKYIYITDEGANCQGSNLIDKYGGYIDNCADDAICTTVLNKASGKNEVGCFITVSTPAEPESTPQASSEPSQPITPTPPVQQPAPKKPTPPACDADWTVTCCDNKNDSLSCPNQSTFKDLGYNYWANEACNSHNGYGSCVSGKPPPDNPAPVNSPTTAKYRVADSQLHLETAQWQQYSSGGVIVSVPSNIYSIDIAPGKKAIFVQFLDSNGKFIKFSNGSEVDVLYIDLNKPVEAIATIETSPTVSGTNKTWESNLVNISLSGFEETGKTLVEVYFRNPIGSCDINTCGFVGWTKIRSYGTNGFDQFTWTPHPGDVDAGLHMFGIFSLNENGEANKILSVSPTNYVPK